MVIDGGGRAAGSSGTFGRMTRAPTAQDRAEVVLSQVEAALRIAKKVGAPPNVIEELRAIHLRLHQRGLRHNLQGSFF